MTDYSAERLRSVIRENIAEARRHDLDDETIASALLDELGKIVSDD